MSTRPKSRGVKKVAEVLNQMSRPTSDKLLAFLDEEDFPLAKAVREEMFLFEELQRLDGRSLQVLLREIPGETLLVALKGVDEFLKETFLSALSSRAAQILREDLALLGAVRVAEVQAAQQAILQLARQLEAKGKLLLGRADDVVL